MKKRSEAASRAPATHVAARPLKRSAAVAAGV